MNAVQRGVFPIIALVLTI